MHDVINIVDQSNTVWKVPDNLSLLNYIVTNHSRDKDP